MKNFKEKKTEREKPGKPKYVNKNCWLVKSLNYGPYKRCQYCELKFRNCLFLQYQIISLILVFFILILSFLIEGKMPELVIISVFTLIIVYGYFFSKSTDKIIQANFNERKAKEALEELSRNLQKKVDEQTKEIRKSYEVEKKAHEELKKLDKAKNQFILATQHHLRTPLTGMLGYLDLIFGGSYGKVPAKLKNTLKRFESATKILIRLVNEFLDISQFQLGREVIAKKPDVQIESILKEIVDEINPEAEAKNLYIKIEQSKKMPSVNADPEKLKVALFNIIDNGIKYTNKGGITIKVETIDSNIRFAIKDTGTGIAQKDLKFLFNKLFERGEKADKFYATGRGIGLFISTLIIEAHRGRIWAESKGKDKGSIFYIQIPIK
ncbi:HAMP domain-containing histidine kinase [Patescibacteria group bacterium]|nr:HAMP domain-containing histidine kinase [Patescibacteria group bacterium]